MSDQYVMVDEFNTLFQKVKTALSLPVLNYQYGYVAELNENMKDMVDSPADRDKRFPLVWVAQPFSIMHGDSSGYAVLSDCEIFIIMESAENLRATERMTDKFKPVINPIYDEMLEQMINAPWCCEMDKANLKHKATDRYYWGESQAKAISDIFDCKHIQFSSLKINNKSNCSF